MKTTTKIKNGFKKYKAGNISGSELAYILYYEKDTTEDIESLLGEIANYLINSQSSTLEENLIDEIIQHKQCHFSTILKLGEAFGSSLTGKHFLDQCLHHIDKETWDNFLKTGKVEPEHKTGFCRPVGYSREQWEIYEAKSQEKWEEYKKNPYPLFQKIKKIS